MEPNLTNLGGSLLVPSVQELAKEALVTVPPRYLRPDHDLHVLWSLSAELPVIDMQRLSSKDSSDFELKKLHLACKDWGFFQMINHGMSFSLLDKVKEDIQEFFKMPMEEKKKFWQTVDDIQGFGQVFVVSEEQKLD